MDMSAARSDAAAATLKMKDVERDSVCAGLGTRGYECNFGIDGRISFPGAVALGEGVSA